MVLAATPAEAVSNARRVATADVVEACEVT
jgi:hypothetical protein